MVTNTQAAGRQCLLDQAQKLFSSRGYHAVSVRDIVQACGLSNAALYYHFGSKQSLFVAVIRQVVARAARQVQEAGTRSGSCRERVAGMARAHAGFIAESHSELQSLFRDLKECDGDEIQHLLPEVIGQIPSLFAAVLEQGIAAGEVRPLDTHRVSILLLGMITALSTHRPQGQASATLTDEIDLAVSTLFDGIGA